MATPAIRDYRDLLVWQKAMDLALLCERITDRLPRSAAHLSLQLRRAVNSVHSNIAEGNGRFSRPDYLRHLSIASGSLREAESHLHFASRRYGQNADIDAAFELCVTTGKLLGGLVRSLKPKPVSVPGA